MSNFIKKLPLPIAVVGLGKSGQAATELLKRFHKTENIYTYDDLGQAQFNSPDLLIKTVQPQTLVVSPGVPLNSEWIKTFQTNGGFITSEIGLAASCLTVEKTIGVTGSLGKSTTVSLLNAALNQCHFSFFVGGNIGIPFAEYILEVMDQKRSIAEWVVLELSSYQLENCFPLKLNLSAITFLAPNHLERYSSLNHYYQTKWKIHEITSSKCFLNPNGGDLKMEAMKHNNIYKNIVFADEKSVGAYHLSQNQMIGAHNLDNLILAASLAQEAKWPETAIVAMKKFKGMPHRIENVGEYQQILYINDSKSTTLESVIGAVSAAETILEKNKIHLLLGGKDKNLPWEKIQFLQSDPRLLFYFFGKDRNLIQTKCLLPGPSFSHLKDAVIYVKSQAGPGDIVLLSPGGTSLDEFKSFEDRGNFFKQLVLKQI